jgi:NAD(P)-dependent dehydrogenase (short-subunit alcohol dehydrogenase family)
MQVNAVAPWFVATEPVKRFYPERVDEALDPRDVAATIKFLLSGAADGISGQVIELRSKRDHGSDSG